MAEGTPLSLLSKFSKQNWEKGISMNDQEKQQRLEKLTFFKAHLDVIAVSLAVVFLIYQIRKVSNDK